MLYRTFLISIKFIYKKSFYANFTNYLTLALIKSKFLKQIFSLGNNFRIIFDRTIILLPIPTCLSTILCNFQIRSVIFFLIL